MFGVLIPCSLILCRVSSRLRDLFQNVAKQNNIPVQTEVTNGGAEDSAELQRYGEGRPAGITRILCLKTLSLKVRAGRAMRTHKLVKSAGPDDLVFQSVQTGRPMNDQNILKRHIQPAARKMGLPFVNWRCLRTSHATWLVQAGADPKSVQGQMRHSRISTTMDIYAQIVPTAQRRALEQLAEFAKDATPDARSNSRSITVHYGPIKQVFQ